MKIWNEYTMYCSQGVTDPDYCVLGFTAQTGRYYTNFSKVEKDFTLYAKWSDLRAESREHELVGK